MVMGLLKALAFLFALAFLVDAQRSNNDVCIVGAGPAGLTAAYQLELLGYYVVVLESTGRVGGRAYNFRYENQEFEMGALFGTPYYEKVLELVRANNFTTSKFFANLPSVDSRIAFDPDVSASKLTITQIGAAANTPTYQAAVLKYISLVYPYPELNTGATLNALPRGDLHLPMIQWLQKYNITILAGFFATYGTTYGYGALDYTPALYYVKYANMFDFLSYLNALTTFFRIDQTYEALFKAMAATLKDVRLNVAITEVKRDGKGKYPITISWNPNKSVKCRRLIIASPKTEERLSFMDLDQKERDIFSKVKLEYYWSSLVDLTGKKPEVLPPPLQVPPYTGVGILRGGTVNPILQGVGEVVAFATLRLSEGLPDVHTIYSWSRTPKTTEEIQDKIITGVQSIFGANITNSDIKVTLLWDYFPQVRSDDVESGFYEKLEGLQGYRNTYYVGALMTFDLVERVVAYSIDLVNTKFLTWSAF